MKQIRILILEDDLEAVSEILKALRVLEDKQPVEFNFTVFSSYKDVGTIINNNLDQYGIVLLDRDCIIGGSFHVLDIEACGPEKIISISSTPQWNTEAQARGVSKVVFKDFQNLSQFAQKVSDEVEDIY